MNCSQLISSAAVYFSANGRASVPVRWFKQARSFFMEFDLSPILFTASGGSFAHDDTYFIDGGVNELSLWGERLPAGGERLAVELANGNVASLGIDTPHADAEDRSDWSANLRISMSDGTFYLGADEQFVPSPICALNRACETIAGTFKVHYGIAYQSGLADYPDGYAHGFVKSTLEDVRSMIRDRRAWDLRPKTPEQLWRDEINGPKRHLNGLFRGAYPANLLSEAHVNAADLRADPIGRLSELSDRLWLWELSAGEISAAEAMLESKRLLVRQASHD